MTSPQTAPRDAFLASALEALAFAIPLFVTAWRVSHAPGWQEDVSLVQALGFLPGANGGAVSAVLSQIFTLLPLGGRLFRASLVGAFSTGLLGVQVYGLSRELLARRGGGSWLGSALALSAALIAALSPGVQNAAGPTGAVLATGLALALVRPLASPRSSPDEGSALGKGALFGCLALEHHILAIGVVGAFVVRSLTSRRPTPWRIGFSAAAGSLLVGALFSIPFVLRPLAPTAGASFGSDFASLVDMPRSALGPLAFFDAIQTELGLFIPALSALGFVLLAFGRRTRVLGACLSAVCVAFAGWGVPAALTSSADPLLPLRLLTVSVVASAAAVGVFAGAELLRNANVPFAKPARALLVSLNFALVFAAGETSADSLSRRNDAAADVWTDEALGELPPGSVVLLRTPRLAYRLWAARLVRGERPDLTVVPAPLLGRGRVAERVLEDEPLAGPLIRDIAVSGRASEYTLTALSDSRPLFVELDPGWERRLLDHLRPTPLWLAFMPHTLGRSDRKSAVNDTSGRRAFRRVFASATTPRDAITLEVLEDRAKEQAAMLAALGDRESTERVLADVSKIAPNSEFPANVGQRLGSKHALDLRDLLR